MAEHSLLHLWNCKLGPILALSQIPHTHVSSQCSLLNCIFTGKKFSTQQETFQVLFDFSDQTPCANLLHGEFPPRLLLTVHFHLKHLHTNFVSLAEDLCAPCIMPSNSDKDCHYFVFFPSDAATLWLFHQNIPLSWSPTRRKQSFFRSRCMRICFIDKINNFYTFLSGVILPLQEQRCHFRRHETFYQQCRWEWCCHFRGRVNFYFL